MNRRDAIKTALGASALAPRLLATAVNPPAGADTRSSFQPLPRIEVHSTGHFLQTAEGRPFFWLGDTAWELIHGTTREECSYYLRTRAIQGFSVIQTVILSEFDGLNRPSDFGEKPLIDNDPRRLNPAYFKRVVEIVDEAAANGLYVALVPTWGDKLTAPWGAGPRIFTLQNLDAALDYGSQVGALLRDRTNVIWLLGGDRPAKIAGLGNRYLEKMAAEAGFSTDQDWTPIWDALAKGIETGLQRRPLIVFHPQGGEQSSSTYLHAKPWLSVNGMQSGHGGGHDVPVWNWISRDYAMRPSKPTLDLEPNYEDHPYNPWPRWDPATGYFRDHDARKQTYRSVFAGGCGVTYGHHAIWQFACARREVINHADRDWIDALWRPGGRQMRFLRSLVESRPFFTRVPDQTLIAGETGSGGEHLQATRDAEGRFAFVYFPTNDRAATIRVGKLAARQIRAWWYDPRTGVGTLIDESPNRGDREFKSPPNGPDSVLVLDGAEDNFAPPGLGLSLV